MGGGNAYIWNSASRISMLRPCSLTFCMQTRFALASLPSLSRKAWISWFWASRLMSLGLSSPGFGSCMWCWPGRAHAADGARLQAVRRGHQAGADAVLCRAGVLRVHHQPLVLLLGVVLLEALGLGPVDVVDGDGAEVGAAVRLDDDQVARLDRQAGSLLDVEDVGPRALEEDDVQGRGPVWLRHPVHAPVGRSRPRGKPECMV